METTMSKKSVLALPCNIVYPSQKGKFPQQQSTESATTNCLRDFGQYGF
jgi:lipase chaperone LimK